VFIDDSGRLSISATQSSITPEMRREVEALLIGYGRPELARREATLHQVKYDMMALEDFHRRALQAGLARLGGVTGGGIDEVAGKVLVSVEDGTSRSAVMSQFAVLAIPSDAISIAVTGPINETVGLRDTHSTMRAGLSVSRTTSSYCTTGLVGWRVDPEQPSQPDLSYKVVTTASHCTANQELVQGNVFGQPLSTRRIGVEVDEAIVYPVGHPTCLSYDFDTVKCRWADVAVIHVDDSISISGGTAAKSSPTVWPNNPPFLGSRSYTGSGFIGVLVGDSVMQIGATTGERKGKVTKSCQWRTSPGLGVTLCAHAANILAQDGDSGGLIYVPSGMSSGTPTPKPAGVQFQSASGETYFSPMNQVTAALVNAYFVAW
jgi:hypothetical protein